mgnify:FL=1
MINVENDTEDYEKYCINKLDMQKIPLIWKNNYYNKYHKMNKIQKNYRQNPTKELK